jgi:tetratricopeptide (TPR) repeat protein
MNEPHDPNRTVDVSPTPDGPLRTTDPVPDPLSTTDHAGGPAGDTDSRAAAPGSDPSASDIPMVPGYRVLRVIARGGMGRVLAARDLALDREVALKILLPGANADRFMRESKITARLPHPGIPPVHALGTLADGSPFLAMKLVVGQTLAREMTTADRPRLVQVFGQVCQAVGFAHSRGIIHRDLKPSNIMVGAFGEVQVMDWGLAKVLASQERERPEEATPVADAPGSPDDLDQTQAGQVLGTPAYMAPEQARGEAANARADVFALGAILCEILTGKPPYTGSSAREVIRRAAVADLADARARLEASAADAELVVLCRRCLSPDPADRPASAQAVADAVTAYLNGVEERLQAAERARAVAVAREAEQRKRRRVQLALAGAVVLMLVGGGAFAWWQDRQATERKAEARNKELLADQGVDAALKLVPGLRKEYKFKAAEAALAQAADLARGGAPHRLAEVEQARRDLAFVVRLDDIRYRKWIWIMQPGGKGAFNLKVAAPAYRRTFTERGLDLTRLDPAEAAKRIAVSGVKAELVAAVDDWALFEPAPAIRDRLLNVARRADPGPWTDRLRDRAVHSDRGALAKLARDADAARASPAALSVLAERMGRLGLDPAPRLIVARTVYPDDFGLAFTLALWHTSRGDERAIGSYEAARALRPENLAVWVNLGAALTGKGQVEEAIACYQRALQLDPHSAMAHNNLGNALARANRIDEAIASWRRAIQLDPKGGKIHANLGRALQDKGQAEEAIACYKKALELNPNLVDAHANLGELLYEVKKDYDRAISCFQRALALDPKNAKIHFNLGNAQRDNGQVNQAIGSYRKAIALDPKDAAVHYNLGNLLARQRQPDEAIACYRKAVGAAPKWALAHFHLGMMLYGKGRRDEGIACWRRATALDPKDPLAHGALGEALLGRGEYAEAREHSARSLALLPPEHPLRAGALAQLQACERMLKLEKRLPRLLRGEDQADSAQESLDLARMCYLKRMHAATARFFGEAFAAAPALASSRQVLLRYRAACAAALAAAGQGTDAAKLDEAAKGKLRRQALDWLKAEVAAWDQLLDAGAPQAGPFIVRTLKHWQTDGDLAGLRAAAALAKLPAGERAAFGKLWAEVASLLKKAEGSGR